MDYSQIIEAQTVALLNNPRVAIIMIILSIWTIIWKGFALWKASQNGSKPWFVALLLINSIGILEIIYLFYFSKKKSQQSSI